jgi:hypothetical protein
MDDIVLFKRTGSHVKGNKPLIRMVYVRGDFVIYNKTAKILNVKAGDALMFGFSKKNACGIVFKQKPGKDNYILNESSRNYFRFSSLPLLHFYRDSFNIIDKEAIYFELEPLPDEKGMFAFSILKG